MSAPELLGGLATVVASVFGWFYVQRESKRDEEMREMKARLGRIEENVHALDLDGARRDERLEGLKDDIKHLISMVERL